jgi:hypothetical protein
MKLPRGRLSVRGTIIVAVTLLLTMALTDLARNHRRVVQFQAAWSYDHQWRECERLAIAYAREAGREQAEADRWPEGSDQRGLHLQAVALNGSLRADAARVGGVARKMASELRRMARTAR